MAKKKKSALAGVSAKSFKKAATIEIRDGGQIPGGIQNGVAKLTSCYFDLHKDGQHKGKPFFRASGVVVSGEIPGSKRNVAGLTTSIFRGIYDTKKRDGTVVDEAEHLAWVENELKKLGAEVEGVGADDLEAIVEELAEAQPHFSFTTTQSEPTKEYPNPRVWENWHGLIEDFEEGEEDDEVEEDDDDEEDEEEENEDTEEDDDDDDDDEEDEDEDGDEEEEDDEDEDEEEPTLPEKGDIYKWKPPKKKKFIEVEVTAVFKGKETCNVKDSDTGKTHKGISWDDLEEAD